MLAGQEAELADQLMDRGCVKFGDYAIKANEYDPAAMRSSIYFDLRTADHPVRPGPLSPASVELIGELWQTIVVKEGLIFDHVTGLPNAGVPLVKPLARRFSLPHNTVELVKKTGAGERRTITGVKPGDYQAGDVVLAGDDVITLGHTKMESIAAMFTAGLKVTDILVVINRQRSRSYKVPCRVHAIFDLPTMLEHYLVTGRISEGCYHETLEREWLVE